MKLNQDSLRWQFDVYEWLFSNFGGYADFLKTELPLPTPEFFPEPDPELIFERVKQYAGMANWPCRLETYDESTPVDEITSRMPGSGAPSGGSAGHITTENEEIVIRYNETTGRDPLSLVATFGHELAHYLMFCSKSEPPFGWEQHEFTTDLTGVFMGFGVFLANSSFQFTQWQDHQMQGWQTSRQGYLGELDLSYGLALFCLLKDTDTKPVIRHLKPTPRSYFKTALKHLVKKHLAEIEGLKAVQPIAQQESGAVSASRSSTD